MNKLLIVGHPQSGYEEVEALLNNCGMAPAQPSRRDRFLPREISETLCKAHGCGLLSAIETGSEVRQIDAGPIWQGMALDLMLGNLDQPFWGWSDPQAISLLDYWSSLDPAITFVLVYDKPQSVLTRLDAQAAAGLDPQTLQQRVQGWMEYNAALLHFFQRHPQRCVLVHTQQVRESAASYLQQMRARIDAPWLDRVEPLSEVTATKVSESATIRPPIPAPDSAIATILADALLCQHPASLQLYEELQSSANLPLGDEASQAMPAALDAWQSMLAFQLELQARNLQLHEMKQATVALQARLEEAESRVRQIQPLKAEPEGAGPKVCQPQSELLQENELLLNQLHLVQEELERYYLETQQLKQKSKPAKPPEPVYYGAGQRVRQQLSYKLGATMIEGSRSVGGWFSMPIELMRVARQHKHELSLRAAQKLPPIHKYRDAHEAERYRNHLSYRLGQTLLKNVRSPIGWARLPFAFRHEVREFRLRQHQG